MVIKSLSTFLVLLVLLITLTPSFGATIDVFSHDVQGDLRVDTTQLTMLSHSQVHPSPELFTDGQIHVALGAPEISISFDGSSFGPLMATLTSEDSEITYSTLNRSPISRPGSRDRATIVPVEQLPFAPLDIPNNSPGGVGGSLAQAFQVTEPINPTTASPNLVPTPLPKTLWLYLSWLSLWWIFQEHTRRQRHDISNPHGCFSSTHSNIQC